MQATHQYQADQKGVPVASLSKDEHFALCTFELTQFLPFKLEMIVPNALNQSGQLTSLGAVAKEGEWSNRAETPTSDYVYAQVPAPFALVRSYSRPRPLSALGVGAGFELHFSPMVGVSNKSQFMPKPNNLHCRRQADSCSRNISSIIKNLANHSPELMVKLLHIKALRQ